MATQIVNGKATVKEGSSVAQSVFPNVLQPGDQIVFAKESGIVKELRDGGQVILTSPWKGTFHYSEDCQFILDLESPNRLEAARTKKRGQIDQDRDDMINGGFTFNAVAVDSDTQSRSNIMLAAQLSVLPGAPESIDWRMKDNSIVTLNQNGVLGMAATLGQHVLTAYQTSWTRKAALEVAQTTTDIDAV